MSHNCAVCNRSVYDEKTNTSIIPINIQIDNKDGAFQRIYPELNKDINLNVCYVCWFKTLGVTIPND